MLFDNIYLDITQKHLPPTEKAREWYGTENLLTNLESENFTLKNEIASVESENFTLKNENDSLKNEISKLKATKLE